MGFEVFDLDAVDNRSGMVDWAIGWETRRWARDVQRLAQISTEAQSRHIVVDVGAGSLQTPEGRAYFRSHSDSTITVVAPWQQVYGRRQPRPYTLECFQATEYSPDRLAAYAASRFTVDASASEDQAACELEGHLTAMWDTSHLNHDAAEQ